VGSNGDQGYGLVEESTSERNRPAGQWPGSAEGWGQWEGCALGGKLAVVGMSRREGLRGCKQWVGRWVAEAGGVWAEPGTGRDSGETSRGAGMKNLPWERGQGWEKGIPGVGT